MLRVAALVLVLLGPVAGAAPVEECEHLDNWLGLVILVGHACVSADPDAPTEASADAQAGVLVVTGFEPGPGRVCVFWSGPVASAHADASGPPAVGVHEGSFSECVGPQ